ncbi:MAG: hypothetical protein ABDI19_05435 [Armatimonadota bacterium]
MPSARRRRYAGAFIASASPLTLRRQVRSVGAPADDDSTRNGDWY